uniref:Uncharacterized protein ycf49 n=1 Tax=Cyanophora paradoxa TaxID=2762 RepID=YCF49_CYAPA|nr:hypothetical protein CypaCp064 [Cyanophora paradoxa]P15811.1 RecName: Full=Uncharacterized protein ycf49; AltName: Full=ORF102 [Cyanophora paradoxa]AAA81232.1 orf102 [Cyanophora paradoxa]CAA35535.1 hypothetical protein [Cyanophora paradoxa]
MNVLSYFTWFVHLSSVLEWLNIIYFFLLYTKLKKNLSLKTFIFSFFISFCSALCACTLHFFNNQSFYYFLINLQSFLTLFANITLYFSILIYKQQILKNQNY